MTTVQADFQERVREIESYFLFVSSVDTGANLIVNSDTKDSAYASQDQNDLVRTLKATAFLLLYNLMESTVSNAIEAIYDELDQNSINFDSCSNQIRRIVLANLKQHNVTEILPSLCSISSDIVTKTFKKDKIVSGNVDAKKIREVAADYGFASPNTNGDCLLTVKTSRNDLAHGSKSFAEVGRNYTTSELIIMKERVVDYLTIMLSNVATYISGRQYLSSPPSVS